MTNLQKYYLKMSFEYLELARIFEKAGEYDQANEYRDRSRYYLECLESEKKE